MAFKISYRILSILLISGICLLNITGCTGNKKEVSMSPSDDFSEILSSIDKDTESGSENTSRTSGYSFKEYLLPVWENNIVYNETILMIKDENGAKASLLYTPENVLSVKSPDLSITYEEGKDYEVKGNYIILTENSSAIYVDIEEVYPSTPNEKTIPKVGGGLLAISLPDGKKFCQVQLAVTYTHSEQGFGDYVFPNFDPEKLPGTIGKLENKEQLKMILYGDSIAAGAETSGFYKIEPNMPSWGTLIWLSLFDYYKSNILFENPSVGGKASDWGRDNAINLVADKNPDLVIIAFGMGDAHSVNNFHPDVYKANIKSIIEDVRNTNPACEFILVSTMLANPVARGFSGRQKDYVKPLSELEQELDGVAFADITSAHEFLLTRKNFLDMSGNGVNHPSDFLARIYAQIVLELLIP